MPFDLRFRLHLSALLVLTSCGGEATSPLDDATGDTTCTIDVSKLLDGGVAETAFRLSHIRPS